MNKYFACLAVLTFLCSCDEQKPVFKEQDGKEADLYVVPEKQDHIRMNIVDKKGRAIQAETMAIDEGHILFKKLSDSRVFKLSKSKLSEETRSLIEKKGSFNEMLITDYDLNILDVTDMVKAKKMITIDILTSRTCEICEKAKQDFKKNGIKYFEERLVGTTSADRAKLKEWGVKVVPSFKIGDQVLAGYDYGAVEQALLNEYRARKK